MGNNETYGQNTEKEPQKTLVRKTFDEALCALEAEDAISFGGFYTEKSNTRARTQASKVSFNEENLHIPEAEIERVCWHEIQHGLWSQEVEESEGTCQHWAFVFHPVFTDLYTRMKAHYDNYSRTGYPFVKKLLPLPLPQTYDDMEPSQANLHFEWVAACYATPATHSRTKLPSTKVNKTTAIPIPQCSRIALKTLVWTYI